VSALNTACLDGASGEERLEQILCEFAQNRADAGEALRLFLSPGLRWFLRRKAAIQNINHSVDSILDEVLVALRSGRVQSAPEVQSYMRSAALNVAGKDTETKQPLTPAQSQTRAMKLALKELTASEQEAIARYFRGESAEQICADLQIGPQQFSAVKAALRARFNVLDNIRKPAAQSKFGDWLRAHTA
jgi:hypothetical protein